MRIGPNMLCLKRYPSNYLSLFDAWTRKTVVMSRFGPVRRLDSPPCRRADDDRADRQSDNRRAYHSESHSSENKSDCSRKISSNGERVRADAAAFRNSDYSGGSRHTRLRFFPALRPVSRKRNRPIPPDPARAAMSDRAGTACHNTVASNQHVCLTIQAKGCDAMVGAPSRKRVRTLFISDVHLGMRSAHVLRLIDFLKKHDAEQIYLVGDIFDGWKLKKSWHWAPEYNVLAQVLLEKTGCGTAVVYLAGNHDEFLRQYLGLQFGHIKLVDRAIHTSAAGRRYLVIHGDQFDTVVANYPRLSHFGHWAYNLALGANRPINRLRRGLGLKDWSLSSWAKQKVKSAANVTHHFEAALTREALQIGVDGVICGHIHQADMHRRLGIEYLNCGDWLESCTAIAEDFSGKFELIRWTTVPAEHATATPGEGRLQLVG